MGKQKAHNKQDKAANRRTRKNRNKNKNGQDEDEEDLDFLTMKHQLEKLGLTLKEITGDGNCLFRALADQMYGNNKAIGGYHLKLRREVVHFMRDHREDFEPFVDDEVTFDRYLDLLEQDGTYAGHDALVAFARLHGVTIVIHQLNEPLWQIHGSPDSQTRCPKELHISYHNGDHYNSVRRIGDLESNEPANLRIDIIQPVAVNPANSDDGGENDEDVDEDGEGNVSDYENVPNQMELDRRVLEVREKTGETNTSVIHVALEEAGYDVEAAVDRIKRGVVQKSHSGSIWSAGGTGSRIFGDDVAKVASSRNVPAVSSKAIKKSIGKKMKRRDKTKNSDEASTVTLVPTLQTLSL